jgi:phosphatidylglycerophosphate synthase
MKDDGPGDGEEHDYAKPLLTFKKKSAFVRNAMLALPRWVTPNGVTIFRTFLVVPVAYLLRERAYWPALVTLAVAMILDFVDGALAEARGEKTLLGAFLDPLSDKVIICGTLLALVDRLPWAFTPVIIAICAIALSLTAGRVVKMARQKPGTADPPIAAKPSGKLKLVAETVSLLLTVIGLAVGVQAIVWIAFAGFAIALYYAFSSFRDQVLSRVKIGS